MRAKREVGRNDLTSSQALLYLWLLSVRSKKEGLSVGASHGTGYGQEQWPTGQTVQESGNIGHLHVVSCSWLSSEIYEKILAR